jgi:peptidylprolyl isomerase
LKLLGLTCVALIALIAAGCGGSSGSSTESSAASTQESAEGGAGAEASGSGAEKTEPKVTAPKGPPPKKLVIKDIETGTGAEAKAGDEVEVQYVGVNYKRGDKFDASWDRNEPFPLQLGSGTVIPGWEKGIEGMKVGGRRELIIPPSLAYGPAGRPPSIPPNETLIFVIDLLSVN